MRVRCRLAGWRHALRSEWPFIIIIIIIIFFPSTVPGHVEGGGQPVLSSEQCFILFSSFPLLFAFVVGGLGFEFCVFVAAWRHALRSEWPFIIIIIII